MVKGFSLLELLFALTITLVIGLAGFQLFRQYERLFQTQTESAEIQQNLRAVVLQITDEIRRAGQGVPVYAARLDNAPGESVVIVLNGSDSSHLRIREGYNSVESNVTTSPAAYKLNLSRTVAVNDASAFTAASGTNSPHGRFGFIWGSGGNSCWSWVRAELNAIDSVGNTLTLIPRQIGDNCRVLDDTVQFTAAHTVDLEEVASIYLSSGSIWRVTATDLTDPSAPLWSAASELGRNFAQLSFTYYDANDAVVVPQSLAERSTIVRIDVAAQTESGESLTMRGYPRNLRIP